MQKRKAFKRLPNTHKNKLKKKKKKKKKSRFGVRVKESLSLGLTEGAEQSFVFWNVMCGKATGVSFLARHLVLARYSCSSTSFVGSSVHVLSFELSQWVRKSHVSLVRCSN